MEKKDLSQIGRQASAFAEPFKTSLELLMGASLIRFYISSCTYLIYGVVFVVFSNEAFSVEPKEIPLNLVIEQVVKNQWDILISSENIMRQKGIVQSARGPFDPIFDTDATQIGMRNVQYSGIKTNGYGNTTLFNAALTKKSRVGTQTTLGAETYRTRNPLLFITDNVPTKRLNTVDVFFIIDQPLLRGFINNADFINERVARVELEAVTYDFVQTISDQIRNTVNIYWDLVAEQQFIEIRRKSQMRISELIEFTKKLIEAGELALTETYQQVAELAQEETQELAIQTDLNTTFQELLFQMSVKPPPNQDITKNMMLDPFPEVVDTSYFFPLQKLLEIAWGNRADLKSSELRTKETLLLLKGANNEVLPHLNLRGRLDYKNSEIGPNADSPFSAFSTKRPEMDWAVTVEFSYPICNNAALGNQRAVSAETRQAMLAQEKLTERIRSNLTAVFQNHRTLLRELKAAGKSVEAYQENLDSELKRLKEGYSTIFIVIDFQRRLNDALTRQVDARRKYAQNFIELLYATGTLVNYDKEQNIACVADLKGLHLISGVTDE